MLASHKNNIHLIIFRCFSRLFRLLAYFAFAFALPAFGHHSVFTQFDKTTVMEIEGTVENIQWRNPHTSIFLSVADKSGKSVTWRLEAGGVSQLVRTGLQRDYVNVGDHIRAAGWPPITDKKEMFVTNVMLDSGDEYLLHRNAPPRWSKNAIGDQSYQFQTTGDSSRPELGIFRVWSHTDVSPFLIPEDLDRTFDVTTYPLTAAAKTTLQSFDRLRDNPTRNCRPKGMPTIMEQPYPMMISRVGDDIQIHMEEYDSIRLIHMNRQAIPADAPYSRLGYSVGRWDGTALLVTTSKIDWPWFDQTGIPQSREVVLSERFIASADGSRLDYEMIVRDPVNFNEPVALQKYWLYIPGREVLPYECTPDQG